MVKLSSSDLRQLADIAIAAATEAGQMIATSRPQDVEHKAGHSLASQVVTEVDRRSEQIILDLIGPTIERFDLGLLTEERTDDHSRLSADYFWCVDPLDGTLPFIEGVAGYAVSIALVTRHGTPCIGVIYDPVEGTLLHATAGGGAFRNGTSWSLGGAPSADTLTVFADRSFFEMARYDAIAIDLGGVADELGYGGVRIVAGRGAVMNACGVLANTPACYVKFPGRSGGGHLWDFAAAACVFREVGAVATDFHGGALDLNRGDATNMAHRGIVFATSSELAARLRTLRKD